MTTSYTARGFNSRDCGRKKHTTKKSIHCKDRVMGYRDLTHQTFRVVRVNVSYKKRGKGREGGGGGEGEGQYNHTHDGRFVNNSIKDEMWRPPPLSSSLWHSMQVPLHSPNGRASVRMSRWPYKAAGNRTSSVTRLRPALFADCLSQSLTTSA